MVLRVKCCLNMGIDVAKDVGTLFLKTLRFSTNIIYTYVKRHPVVSGVSLVIFLLYTFLPRLFYFLLYSSPLIACSVFYLRNHLVFKLLNIKSDNIGSEGGGTRKADLKHQRSVRRNARRKVEEVGKDWDSSQASEDERDKVILTTLYGEEFSNTKKSPSLPKFKKDRAFLVAQDFSFDPSLDEETSSTTVNVSVVDPSEKLTSGGGETEIECSSSSEGEEETIHEDRKVVAWTEDDQKNLMDLGNSDKERNKRLQHLISRRRMRKLVLPAAESSSLMDMEVPSISVGRNYFGLDQENYIIDGLQMPESAPCVLLPTKNPFDLPYDPHEDKPNLSGDSFQQEFAANPNDIFFSRHESFCRRIFAPANQLDSKWEPWKKSIDGWPRLQQGSNDQLVGDPLMKGKDLTRTEANDMESEHRTRIVMDDSNSLLLSPGEKEMDPNALNQADSYGTSGKRNGDDHRGGNSLVGLVPRNTGSLSSSLAAERQRYMEHFGYSSRRGHKLTQSVESDLQVEFSEIGSPPTTVDGNISSDNDEKSLFVYESDNGKEIGFSGGEGNEAKQNSTVEKVDHDFNETSSIISSDTDVAKQFESLSDNTNVNGGSEEEDRSKSRDFLLENPDRGSHISEEATVPHTNQVVLSSCQDSQELLQNLTDEMKRSYEFSEPEPSDRRTIQESEEHCEGNDGGQSTQEMQELVQPEVSNVNHVTENESATSPRSVLPDMLLPLVDQTYTLTSESLEHSSDSPPQPVIP